MSALALDDSRLLDTWDRAASLARPWRELALLASATGISVDELARLTIGERDRLLLALRIGTFGNRLECETRCPSCETRLELSFDASALMVPVRTIAEDELEMAVDGSVVRFRLPDSNDVAAAMRGADLPELLAVIQSDGLGRHPERSEGSLSLRQFEQLRLESDPSSLALLRMTEEEPALLRMTDEEPALLRMTPPVILSEAKDRFPSRVRQRIADRIAELDPQADISLDLNCAACGHRWQAPFDPAAFLFREVESHVTRLTSEVHQLARAYAWSEESILAMGPTRRRRYLNLVLQ